MRADDEEGDSDGLGRDFGLLDETEVVSDGSAVLVLGVELVELGGREEYGGFGLSFPVGPLPKAGRLEGGRLRAWRYCSFSSSSSATRCSRAWVGRREVVRGRGDAINAGTDLEMSSATSAEGPLDVSGPVRGEIVVSLSAALRRHLWFAGEDRAGQESRWRKWW